MVVVAMASMVRCMEPEIMTQVLIICLQNGCLAISRVRMMMVHIFMICTLMKIGVHAMMLT